MAEIHIYTVWDVGFGRTIACREAGMHHQEPVSASAMDHGHGLSLSTQESIVFTSFLQDVNTEWQHTTLWDQTDTNQFTATHNLMGSRRHQWIYRSLEQLKDTAEDMGISVLGLVPLWIWIPSKDGLITMRINSHHWELNVMPVLDGHHTALGWLPSLHPPRPMFPSSAPQPPTLASSRDLESVQEIVPRV